MLIKFFLGLGLAVSVNATAKPVRISSFMPENLTESINQIRVTFSHNVVPIGPNIPADIFDVRCQPQVSGRASWLGQNTWLYDFHTTLTQNRLPGGSACLVKLKKAFKKIHKIVGKTEFAFQVDGPSVVSMYPESVAGPSATKISEDQVFAIQLDGLPDLHSVVQNVHFVVDGIASTLPVRILSENEAQVLTGMSGFSNWQVDKSAPLILLRSKTPFPPNRKVSLVWGAGVQSSNGKLARKKELIFPFVTRPLLTATLVCNKENAKADCSPLSDIELSFSAPIPAQKAKEVELVSADGKRHISATVDPLNNGDNTVTRVIFPASVEENQTFQIIWPKDVRDDAGRPLKSFPSLAKTGVFPPLVKFASDFGIIESKVNPILLPVTMRNLEAEKGQAENTPTSVDGAYYKVDTSHFANVVQWIRALDEKSSSARVLKDRDRSIFTKKLGAVPKEISIPKKEGGKPFEVGWIPLDGPGLHIVELRSRILGRALLGQDATMYVPTGALVTNMVVHSKWGVENSLFWVTTLEGGEPVEGAKVSLHDCAGKTVWSTETDEDGRAFYNGDLKEEIDLNACETEDQEAGGRWRRFQQGFFVSAEKEGDFTFTHSSWDDGIETWRFGSLRDFNEPSLVNEANSVLATTVFDRTLVKAGEKEPLGMKHFLRAPLANRFKLLPPQSLPTEVQYVHSDTGAVYSEKIEWDANGTAVSFFPVPKEAQTGLYNVNLVRKNGKDIVESYPSGSFHVSDFKVPLLKGSIAFSPHSQPGYVKPDKIQAQLSVMYQAGGPDVNDQVVFNYSIRKRDWLTFENFGDQFDFGRDRVVEKEGIRQEGQLDTLGGGSIDLRLDPNGSQVVTIPNLSVESPQELTTQLSFTDKNSETQNVTRTVMLYPGQRLVAVKIDNAFSSAKYITIRAAVSDLRGQPIAGVRPKFELFESMTFTNRTRNEGGFYSSDSYKNIKRRLGNEAFKCQGVTNKLGLVTCSVKAPATGVFIVQASVRDDEGNHSYGHQEVFVHGQQRAWFPSENNDRMDLIPEKRELQAGEVAKLQVQMPFAAATVLVTVEREGIVDSFVEDVSTIDPVLEVKMKPEYAPNVFISVLAVRGRIPGTALAGDETATVDLAKPAYKLGMTSLRVNWKENTLKVAVKPEKEAYRTGDWVTADVAITTPGGQPVRGAEFAVAVVDEGLLEIAKNRSWDVLKFMMDRRPLSVQTASAQMQVVGKRHFGLKATPVSGDGGLAPIRELTDPRVYWNPREGITDAKGRAKIRFQLNDSLSSFRIAAIAHNDLNQFGTGEHTIRSSQELQILSSLGTVVRDGDRIATEFTIRNQTSMKKSAVILGTAKVVFEDGHEEVLELTKQPLTLEAQGSQLVNLSPNEGFRIPDKTAKVEYQVSLYDSNKALADSIRFSQEVKPSVLPRTWSTQLVRVEDKMKPIEVHLPKDAFAHIGGLHVALKRSLAEIDTLQSQATSYPFENLEGLFSRAVIMSDSKQWKQLTQKLPSYLDAEGFAKYFATRNEGSGSDVLTAYILNVSAHARVLLGEEFELSDETKLRLIAALISFVEGRSKLLNDSFSLVETFARRVNAIHALAEMGQADPVWLTALPSVDSNQIPTSSLIQLVNIYSHLKTADRQSKIKQYSKVIESRVVRHETGEIVQDPNPYLSDMMTSSIADQLQLILTFSLDPALRKIWGEHLPLLLTEAIASMRNGAWDLSVANAIGSLALRSYATFIDGSSHVSGTTNVSLDGAVKSFDWGGPGNELGGALELGWPSAGDHRVDLQHVGSGAPWALVFVRAAIPLKEPIQRGIELTKAIEPKKEIYQKGDEVQVTLSIRTSHDLPFVSVMDPVPAGAKILSVGQDGDYNWPRYQSISYDAYRATYDRLSSGTTLVYKLKVNNAGTFKLPATRVEATYLPDNFAELPNEDWKVSP